MGSGGSNEEFTAANRVAGDDFAASTSTPTLTAVHPRITDWLCGPTSLTSTVPATALSNELSRSIMVPAPLAVMNAVASYGSGSTA
jgi:hypothetical protein